MKIHFSLAAALLASLLSATAPAQQAASRALYESNGQSAANTLAAAIGTSSTGDIDLVGCDECGLSNDAYGCDVGSGGLGLLGGGRGCGQFFAGAEYVYVRAQPSEAIAYAEFNANTDTDRFECFDFGYNSNFRVFGGYRLCNCGEEIRFTYNQFDSDATAATPAVATGSTITYLSPLDIPALQPGERITGFANVELNNYDLGWSKTIPLGSPLCCDSACGDACGCADGCDSCGDACGSGCGCWCPAWDITFTGALRFADVGLQKGYSSFNTAGQLIESGVTSVNFDGVGARMGLQGRRYLGRKGVASVYLRGDISLLAGDLDVRSVADDSQSQSIQEYSCSHIIPVTEIEAGGTMFLTCNTSVSAGYFLGAWHDLGFREDYNFGLPSQYDDANILGFDGFFVRMESAF